MAFTASSIDDILLPPPAKVLKRGTPEIEDAMNKGEVTFSLPPQELAVWLHPHPEQQECAMDVLVEDGSIMASDSNGSMHSDYSNFHDDLSGIQTSLNKEMGDERRNHQVEDEEEATQTQRDDDRAGNDPRASCDTSASSKADVTPSNARKRDIKTMSEQPKTRFRDIIGHGAVKLRLDEILLPLALPTNLADSILTGIRSLSASILLYGPPGCGKTELAKAIAGEAQAAFLSVGPSDILSKFVGESEASIRSMFDKAFEQAKEKESRCTVLFFDEIDALGQSRGVSGMPSSEQSGGGGDVSSRRLLAELLIQLNRINSTNGGIRDDDHGGEEDHYPVGDEESVDTVYQEDHDYDAETIHQDEGPQRNRARVIVVAATNRPEDCDPALVRRFAVRVSVGLPSKRDRKKILNRYLGDVAHNIARSQLDGLAAMTDGWSGSDLESLTREAAMAPIRECIRAAALLKRRIKRREQSGGDSSREENQPDADHHEQARDTLLQHFKTLRQVTVQDFQDAIAFWMGNQSCDGNSQSGGLNDSRRLNHYDSSSDEDD